jgi:hypothetical protein
MSLHEFGEARPGEASLIDPIALGKPLDVAFTDEQCPDLSLVGLDDNLEVFVYDYHCVDSYAHFVSHAFSSGCRKLWIMPIWRTSGTQCNP